jgi:hypothetical protein
LYYICDRCTITENTLTFRDKIAKKAIKSLSNVDDEQLPGAAALLTSWQKKILEGDAKAGEDPSNEEENASATAATGRCEVSPMTIVKSGTMMPLWIRHRGHKLQKPPKPPTRYSRCRAASVQLLTTRPAKIPLTSSKPPEI